MSTFWQENSNVEMKPKSPFFKKIPPLQILQDHPSLLNPPTQHHAPPPVTSMESGPPEYMRMPTPASAFSLIPSAAANVFPRQYLTKPSIVSASDYRDHHNVSPASSSMYQPPPNIGAWPPNWNHPDDEASVSPPHYRYVRLKFLQFFVNQILREIEL